MVKISKTKIEELGKSGDLDKLKNYLSAKLTIEFKNKFPQKVGEKALDYNRRKTMYLKNNLSNEFNKHANKIRVIYMKGKTFKSF